MKWGWRMTTLMLISGVWEAILKNHKRYQLMNQNRVKENEEKQDKK